MQIQDFSKETMVVSTMVDLTMEVSTMVDLTMEVSTMVDLTMGKMED